MTIITAATPLNQLITAYRLCASTEGKSPKTIKIVTSSVKYLEQFLNSQGLPTDVTHISHNELRFFIDYLQHKTRFSDHPFVSPQAGGLSAHTVNAYTRSVSAFWSWLISEEIISENPFHRVKIPKLPYKIVQTFSNEQIKSLLAAVDTDSATGFRDYLMILMLLDTGLRLSELTGLMAGDIRLEEGFLKVMGKGGKERLIPVGREVQRVLWRYISRYRPEPACQRNDFLLLSVRGTRLSKSRIETVMKRYAAKAGITGVRSSPHTLRHTAAVSFMRNGGDAFSLQRLLGHSTLVMTRHYCELADVDVKKAHMSASPVDNLGLKSA